MAAHTNVCVIGLGSMGMGAARACLQAGLNTRALTSIPTTVAHCWRRAPKARAPARCRSPRNWMQLCCWWSMPPPGAGILFGESGLAAHLKPGTVVMVSSTIASADAQAIAEALAEYQLLMLDAPVSGGAVAAAGDMTVMASGSDAAFARLAPVLDAVAGKSTASGATLVLARR
nr:NAD(P)-binding domain-containing protein [Klebsiella pneumoniae subsp. pneumoniae]